MALKPIHAMAARNAQVDAVTRLLDGGFLRLYSGPRPDSADDEPRGTLLAELRFGSPAFEQAMQGRAVAHRIIQAQAAAATGAATWFRAVQADGKTAVFDGTVGRTDADIVMNNNNIQDNAIVSVSTLTYSIPATNGKE